MMQEAKADGKPDLPEWVAENRELRSLLRNTENNNTATAAQANHYNSSELFGSQRKFTRLMKTNPKQAEKLDFRYANN